MISRCPFKDHTCIFKVNYACLNYHYLDSTWKLGGIEYRICNCTLMFSRGVLMLQECTILICLHIQNQCCFANQKPCCRYGAFYTKPLKRWKIYNTIIGSYLNQYEIFPMIFLLEKYLLVYNKPTIQFRIAKKMLLF